LEVFVNMYYAQFPVLLDMLSFPDTTDLRPLILGLVFLGSLGLVIGAVVLLNYFFNKKK